MVGEAWRSVEDALVLLWLQALKRNETFVEGRDRLRSNHTIRDVKEAEPSAPTLQFLTRTQDAMDQPTGSVVQQPPIRLHDGENRTIDGGIERIEHDERIVSSPERIVPGLEVDSASEIK